MNKVHLMIFLLLASVACKQTQTEISLDDITSIDLSDIESHFQNKKMIHSQNIVPLETSQESLIGHIDKVFVKDERVYILDKRKRQALFVFDIMGKFLFKIHDVGYGPGEYTTLFDVTVDEEGNIYLLDVGRRNFIKYDNKGQFIDQNFMEFRTIGFSFLKNEQFVFFQNGRENKGLMDMNFNIIHFDLLDQGIKKSFPFRKPYDTPRYPKLYQRGLLRSKSSVLYRPTFSDTIYDVSVVETKCRYVFNFGKHGVPKEEYFNTTHQEVKKNLKKLREEDYAWDVNNFYENEDFFICSLVFKRRIHLLVYSKLNETYIVKSHKELSHSENVVGDLQPLGVYNDSFIGIERDYLNLKDSNENPSLIFYTIENF